MQAMEHQSGDRHQQTDQRSERDVSSASSTHRDSDRTDDTATYESKRETAKKAPVEPRQDHDDLALLAGQMRARSQDDSAQDSPNEGMRSPDENTSVEKSSKGKEHSEDNLAGAQGETGDTQAVKTADERDGDVEAIESLVEFEPEFTTDESSVEDNSTHELDAHMVESAAQETESVDLNEAKIVSGRSEDDEAMNSDSDGGFDVLEATEQTSDVTESFLEDNSQNSENGASADGEADADIDISSSFEVDAFDEASESRFLDDAPSDSYSDGSDMEANSDQVDHMMSGPEPDASEQEGEWSRLLQGNSLADKVSQSSRVNSGILFDLAQPRLE